MFIKNRGFSLMEIMVTVVIIVVLSAISGPIYNSYSMKTKQAEGYLLLGTIKDAQMKFYNDKGAFCNPSSAEGNGNYGMSYSYGYQHSFLGINAKPNKYYTWFNVNTLAPSNGGNSTFIAVVQGKAVNSITMICPMNGPTTIK